MPPYAPFMTAWELSLKGPYAAASCRCPESTHSSTGAASAGVSRTSVAEVSPSQVPSASAAGTVVADADGAVSLFASPGFVAHPVASAAFRAVSVTVRASWRRTDSVTSMSWGDSAATSRPPPCSGSQLSQLSSTDAVAPASSVTMKPCQPASKGTGSDSCSSWNEWTP